MTVWQLWNDESGANMVEYSLLLALIAIAVAASLPPLASAVGGVFNDGQLVSALNP